MAHLLTPTLEQRASREFLKNQPTGVTVASWMYWIPNWDYAGYWTGYDTNFVENTLGATPYGFGSGSSNQAYRQWQFPTGTYQIHYHMEVKCDTSNSNTPTYWTDDIATSGNGATNSNYYFTGTVNSVNGTVLNSVKQKNVQFCSSRSNTSAIESNRAYVTFDHHLEYSHNGGIVWSVATSPFQVGRGLVTVEDFWVIVRRVR